MVVPASVVMVTMVIMRMPLTVFGSLYPFTQTTIGISAWWQLHSTWAMHSTPPNLCPLLRTEFKKSGESMNST